MTALIRYEAAKSALAEARSVDEVKHIRDKAEAMRAYARMAKDRQMEVDSFEIRTRAERRLGEMLLTAKAAGQLWAGRPTKTKKLSRAIRFTLREAGVNEKLSARAQRLAADERFEQRIADWRDRSLGANGRVATPLQEASVATGLPKVRRERQSNLPFEVRGGDVRLWRVAELRRIACALAAVSEHLGAAESSARVCDVVSDARLAALMGAQSE